MVSIYGLKAYFIMGIARYSVCIETHRGSLLSLLATIYPFMVSKCTLLWELPAAAYVLKIMEARIICLAV
jgi:hypothetical protein